MVGAIFCALADYIIISLSQNAIALANISRLYFNKNADRNWSVPWHQDKTIAVKQKAIATGYKNWTVKQGVTHVQPPIGVLAKITTIRIALDDTNAKNGGLKIIPQSHNLGVLDRVEIDRIVRQRSLLNRRFYFLIHVI